MLAIIGMLPNNPEDIMRIIGITGGVGAGKSGVIEYLQKHYDAVIAKADDLGHAGIRRGEECYASVVDLLGSDIIDEDGELNRAKIATIVHQDKEQLTKLNEIIHPYVEVCIIQMIIKAIKSGKKYFFIEAALLLEANYHQLCDEIWYVYADCRVRRDRLASSRNYSAEKTLQIMDNQLSDYEFRFNSNFVIDNSGDFTATTKQIDARMQKYEAL